MPITSKDLAKQLNLSQSTVSRILSGAPGHRVSEATRERVLTAARELEYRPNAVARSLRSGRTQVIGLYTRHCYDARNEFLGAVLGGLQRACGRQGLDILLYSGVDSRGTEATLLRLQDGRIDGLLVHATADDAVVAAMREGPIPVVAVADALPGIPAVVCDDAAGATALARHLWDRGYRRFRYVAPELALPSVERRLAAFEAALPEQAERAVWRIEFEDADPLMARIAADTAPTPLAVCCWNDRTAYGLLQGCAAARVPVPGRIAVAGFDGFLDLKLPARQLVTVACPWDLVAEQALGLLSRRLAGEVVPCETTLPVRLVSGDTA